MDDTVCPLCCEEFDISDREFYPCKCGYQVCMWCWHRIRESESGLCPACRTPYGEDPHQFSAVDVEEVLKAQRQHKKKDVPGSAAAVAGVGSVAAAGGSVLGLDDPPMEVPKDRSQLANMRVIRRNLVYAVGLPPGIASEDILRKPEYFGQYGKISKIVLNRAVAGDAGRRASASAYVTFVHKEDTLACILALDGFYLENRNIRASYGTSKYCSAFIKNVRCNNPECTYLHEMGAAEDTFTKQEIQAGYVTSGRDVLARQQQIVSEQLRQGAHGGVIPRKRVGGGGPSGTGRASATPIFPPPEYDEPTKPAPPLVPMPAGIARASTVTNVGPPQLNPSNIAAKLGRSSSVGGPNPPLPPQPVASVLPVPAAATIMRSNSIGNGNNSSKSAASVVAGVHTVKSEDSASSTSSPPLTLTPLTPLKRAPKPPPKAEEVVPTSKLAPLRVGAGATASKKLNGLRNTSNVILPPPSLNNTSLMSPIGGEVIGGSIGGPRTSALPPMPPREPVPSMMMAPSEYSNDVFFRSSALGGEVYTGQLPSVSVIGAPRTASNNDKWNSNQTVTGAPLPGLWNSGNLGGGNNMNNLNSTSALASILGINLPTGSGSLRETSTSGSLWPSAADPSPLSALNRTSTTVSTASGFGGSIGGVPIHSGGVVGQKNHSDIALLQSLLPGVHITSGSHYAASNSAAGPSALGGETLTEWASRKSVGAIGQHPNQSPKQGHGIW